MLKSFNSLKKKVIIYFEIKTIFFYIGSILDFGLIDSSSLLLIYKKGKELLYEDYNLETKAFGSNGQIAEDINFYEYERLFLKNINCLNQDIHPYTLALVLEVKKMLEINYKFKKENHTR